MRPLPTGTWRLRQKGQDKVIPGPEVQVNAPGAKAMPDCNRAL